MAQLFEPIKDENGNQLKHFKRDSVTKIIYRHEMISGINFRFSTGETEISKAQKRANVKIAEYFRKGRDKASIQSLIKDELELVRRHYKESAESGSIAVGTYVSTKNAILKLLPFWGNLLPLEISKEKWSQYQDWYEATYEGQNQFNTTKTMKILVTHLIERGILLRRPTIRDRNAKKSSEKRKKLKSRVFTDAEILAIDASCNGDIEQAGIRMMYMMGFRIGDVVNLSWDRIHLEEKVPYIRFTEGDDKADFQGMCPIPDDVVSILKRMERISKWVFPKKSNPLEHWKPQSFDQRWRKIRGRSKVEHGSCHDLRHFRLTRDFKNKDFTSAQVCLVRRISLKTAYDHYIHAEMSDLELLRNAGSINNLVLSD